MRYILSLYLLVLCAVLPLHAQKKKSEANSAPAQTAEQLIQNYRFADAVRVLQRDIDAAARSGKSTDRLESDLRRANLGVDLLRGVERVVFVDSVKVAREQMLSAIHLSSEAGKLFTMNEQAQKFSSLPEEVGQMAYVNELGNRIFFAAADSSHEAKGIWSAYRLGHSWAQAAPLTGLQSEDEDQDFPYVMPDGVTIYFAAQGDESLGGYDIFVTRYDTETKQYLKAENMGMPFNSPANDYLLAIDEASKLGWLVTDRNQKADSVCVYTFIPNDTRDIYDLNEENRSEVTSMARLLSIASTQVDADAVKEARARLQALTEQTANASSRKRRYVISDDRVYTNLSQFRSDAARRIAEQADQVSEQIDELSARYDELQFAAATAGRTEQATLEMKQIATSLPKLRAQYATLCKNMRQAELK